MHHLCLQLQVYPLKCSSLFYQVIRRGVASLSTVRDFPFDGQANLSLPPSLRPTPTISTIIEKTRPRESRIILKRWQERMIKEHGEAEFWKLMQRNKSYGKDFHILANDYLSKQENPIVLSHIRPYYQSVEAMLQEIQSTVAIEMNVIHSALNYRGRLDGIVQINDKHCILEWKTVHTSKRVTSLYQAYDSPMQLAAYAGAYNQMGKGPKISHGLLVYAYGDGAPADVLIMRKEDFLEYWQRWLNRLEKYAKMDAEAVDVEL